MEYQKDLEKFSFGFGSDKVAGLGDMSDAKMIEITKNKNPDKKAVILSAVSGAASLLFAVMKYNRKRKKKAKAKAKANKKKLNSSSKSLKKSKS